MGWKEKQFRDIHKSLLTGAAVAVCVLTGAWLAGGSPCLEVYRSGTATPFLSLAMEPGADFTLWFFHSYDRAFFEEHYRLEQDGRIVLTHMTFKSNLNGQGFEMGTYRSRSDGSAELAGINKDVPEILFRLGSPDLANHTLLIGGRRLPLLNYAEAGDMISIRSGVERRWEKMWKIIRPLWVREGLRPSERA